MLNTTFVKFYCVNCTNLSSFTFSIMDFFVVETKQNWSFEALLASLHSVLPYMDISIKNTHLNTS